MRKTPLFVALSVALAVTPVALAHPDAGHPDRGDKPAPAKTRQGPKGTHYLTHACVVSNATATGVEVKTLSVNRHMRDALAGSPTLAVTIDPATTTIRLVGRARHLPEGSTPKRLPRIGGFADLTAGDRVTVHIRAPRGTAAADLPAAYRIVDHGPSRRCPVSTTTRPPRPLRPPRPPPRRRSRPRSDRPRGT